MHQKADQQKKSQTCSHYRPTPVKFKVREMFLLNVDSMSEKGSELPPNVVSDVCVTVQKGHLKWNSASNITQEPDKQLQLNFWNQTMMCIDV